MDPISLFEKILSNGVMVILMSQLASILPNHSIDH